VSDASPTIGIDLGGTNLRVGVVDHDGSVLAEEREATPDTLPGLLAAMTRHVTAFQAAYPAARALGVGTAGLVDLEGTVHYAPNIPMLRRAPLGTALREALSLPTIVDNDANVAAWGEMCHGASRDRRNVLVITLGTGIGGGIIFDGRVYRGAHGFAAEVGHWQSDPAGPPCACGEPGHWEAAASGNALGRLARERAESGAAPQVLARAGGDIAAITGHHVGDSLRAGEADGRALIAAYAHLVAVGFVGLVNILDPELIVVSGGLVQLGDLLLDPLRAAFDGHIEGAAFRPSVPIVAAELGERAGLVGAGALARELVA
jgi:glucokinase